jgi:hypothetical protein
MAHSYTVESGAVGHGVVRLGRAREPMAHLIYLVELGYNRIGSAGRGQVRYG